MLRLLALALAAMLWSTHSPAQAAEQAVVDGYRSAHFGMTEAEVRKAIKIDLGVGDPVRTTNDIEHTTVLTVTDKSLLPDSPLATISYILGATSSKLIQINVVWGDSGGAEAKQIVATTNALTAYFLDKGGWSKDSQAMNLALPDGTLLAFRGADAKGRMVVLHLIPIPEPGEGKKDGKDKSIPFKRAMLRLSYIADPAKPDVFHIDKGQF